MSHLSNRLTHKPDQTVSRDESLSEPLTENVLNFYEAVNGRTADRRRRLKTHPSDRINLTQTFKHPIFTISIHI